MLVLTRKPGEEIIIGGNIRITVVSVGPGRVKIGIEAPADVKVDRQEIHEKKQADHTAQPVPEGISAPMIVEPKAVAALHNRISEKLLAPVPAAPVAASAVPLENRLKQIARRFPRKPR